MAKIEQYSCDECSEVVEAPADGWLQVGVRSGARLFITAPFSIPIDKRNGIDLVKHFCSLEHAWKFISRHMAGGKA